MHIIDQNKNQIDVPVYERPAERCDGQRRHKDFLQQPLGLDGTSPDKEGGSLPLYTDFDEGSQMESLQNVAKRQEEVGLSFE